MRWMDARELAFEDESFDVVYSLSSLEHFGGPRAGGPGGAEIGRVLRPGGVALLCADVLVRRHPLNAAPVDLAARAVSLGRKRRSAGLRHRAVVAEGFTPRELRRHVIAASGLELMQPLDLSSRRSPGTTSAACTPTGARSRRAAPSSPTSWCRSTARCSRRCACRCGGRHEFIVPPTG